MGLTQAVRLRLESKEFNGLFDDHSDEWSGLAVDARAFMANGMDGVEPTVDDIKKSLLPLVEIHPRLRAFLAENGLTQKYWIADFADYILDRVYTPTLVIPPQGPTT